MNEGLLIVERMILEVLIIDPATYRGICDETGLDTSLVGALLSEFVSRGDVQFKNGHYHLNQESEVIKSMTSKSKEFLSTEIKELFVTFFNAFFEEEKKGMQFKLQKISISPAEELMLNTHFQKLDCFITDLKKVRRRNKLKDQRFIFWGSSGYGELAKRSIDVA